MNAAIGDSRCDPERSRPISPYDVVRISAIYFRLTQEEILGPKRFKSIAHARRVAMYVARVVTKASFPELARVFGNRDHTTVMSGVAKIRAELENDHDPSTIRDVGRITLRITEEFGS